MLMYRKVGLPLIKVSADDIPDYILDEIESEQKNFVPEVAVSLNIILGHTR